ncbi:TonB-linked SusC/RagA family outer membrane protein [Flavobacterium sp. 1]|uniref:SusC/RagA family TonB-linked outer membrane protein n=1 Tax=Flavobacterium sp. 1 TaxID=2035200 RepID=UPI000C239B43|nr:SusC/RagA family TonB-linked outer membrane protein [Flavobacterium sp. 1]PJJ07610.1 TonB-linked SusC/RagA family outer membrane protein [Flavobacterium sp. 1]
MKTFSFSRDVKAFCFLFLMGTVLSLSPIQAKNKLRKSLSINQQQQIQGTVTDGINPLAGVSISIKGKSNATVTDYNGQYTLSAAPEDILIFSYIGYKTQIVSVQGRTAVNISLQENETKLQEVKINAGYYSVKNSERTGSIARITAKSIEKQPVTNVLAVMQGRMAGVNITQTTGVPGGGFNIQIRGRNSLRTEGNDPLYIIDGLPFASENVGNTNLSAGILPNAGINPLNGINPSDIENIEVLKDADATAIYGSRGANGVVLITTKKGRSNKTEVTINAYTGAGKVTRTLDLMHTDQYLEMRREAFANDGVAVYPSYAYDLNGTWNQNRYTDWQKELIGGTALTQNIEAGVSGGNSKTQFLIRATHFRETTVFPGDFSYGKTALHFSINHVSENNKFSINFSGNYVADKNDLLGTDLTRQAIILSPNAPELYTPDGTLNWENGTWSNPLRFLEQKYLAKTNTLVANSVLSYKILPNLELKTTLGFSDTRLDESKEAPSTMYNPSLGLDSSASTYMSNYAKQQSWNIEPQLSWQKGIGGGTINILIGTTFQQRTKDQQALYATGFASNSLIDNIAAASSLSILNNNSTTYRYNAIFGRINYNWRQKYILNATGRRDGSSRFGPDKRFANFGALGAAWLFSKENFIANAVPFLSFGKLRASYGITGSDQIGDYQYLNTYNTSGGNYQGIATLQPIRLYNPDFSWETNKKKEIAIEMGFINDRIFTTVARYSNRSSNQLVGTPLPGTTGFTSVQSNLNAVVENSGWEFELRTVNFQNMPFKWSTTANLTIPKNKLLEFPNLEGSTYASQYVIGESLDIRKVYHYTGINPTTGIYQFEDYNKNGTISGAADRQKIVSINPEFFGGIENSLTYKNWQFDFLFQFVKQIGVNYNSAAPLPGTLSNQDTEILNRWQEQGDTEGVQKYTAGSNGAASAAFNNYRSSDAAYTDASFIRLKNLSLAYTIPESWSKSARCRIYLQGQNLLTFTHFKGLDPENQSLGILPPLQVLAIGVQLTF